MQHEGTKYNQINQNYPAQNLNHISHETEICVKHVTNSGLLSKISKWNKIINRNRLSVEYPNIITDVNVRERTSREKTEENLKISKKRNKIIELRYGTRDPTVSNVQGKLLNTCKH